MFFDVVFAVQYQMVCQSNLWVRNLTEWQKRGVYGDKKSDNFALPD